MATKPALKKDVKKTTAIPASISEVKTKVKNNASNKDAEADKIKQEKVEQADQVVNEVPFDQGKVGALLEEVIAELKRNNRLMESAILKQPIEVVGNKVTFLMSSELQDERFSKYKPELLRVFKRKLQNDMVEIVSEIREEAISEVKKLYTSTDKLAYLTEKSPALKELQKRFGLETDF